MAQQGDKMMHQESSSSSFGSRLPCAQDQSIFFSRLPPEVRRIIFQHVMSDWGWTKRLHIVRDYQRGDFGYDDFNSPISTTRKRRLTYVPCTALSEDNLALSMSVDWPTQHDSCRGWTRFDEFRQTRPKGIYLALSLTCRRTHLEVISLFYTLHTFDLLDMPTAHRFLTHVSLPQLQQIQRLHVTAIFSAQSPRCPDSATRKEYYISAEAANANFKKWAAICSVLQRMEGLKKLVVRVYRHENSGVEERDVLVPLVGISVEGGFEVQLPWSKDEGGWADGLFLPFAVER